MAFSVELAKLRGELMLEGYYTRWSIEEPSILGDRDGRLEHQVRNGAAVKYNEKDQPRNQN